MTSGARHVSSGIFSVFAGESMKKVRILNGKRKTFIIFAPIFRKGQ